MPTLHPSCMNVVVFYGNESCKRFEALLHYWDSILDMPDWSRYLFILIGTAPVSRDMRPALGTVLQHNCFAITPDELNHRANINGVERAIRDGLGADSRVLLHCVCTNLGETEAPPHGLWQLVRDLSSAFILGTVHTLMYLMLDNASEMRAGQRVFAQALSQESIPQLYTYLLGNVDEAQSSISMDTVWRAVYGEILANSAKYRSFFQRGCYSIGYSTLNANDKELYNIRKTQLVKWLLPEVCVPISAADAWKILSQTAAVWKDERNFVGQWMLSIVKRETPLPDDSARKNNRILSGVYQRDAEDIPGIIRRFYELNGGKHSHHASTLQAYCRAHKDRVLEHLCATANASSFPIAFLDTLQSHLESIQSMKYAASEPIFQRRGLLESKTAYCDQCCKAYEDYYAGLAELNLCKAYAAELLIVLETVRAFIQSASAVSSAISPMGLKPADEQQLKDKYPRYYGECNNLILFSSAGMIQLGTPRPYYHPSGAPNIDEWAAVLEEGVAKMKQLLPTGFRGTFCDAVSMEYDTAEGLQNFLGKYLGGSRRMLFNIHDAAHATQPLYYADSAFAGNPWFARLSAQSVVISKNDNVERIDFYPLTQSLEHLLQDQDSVYFSVSPQNDYRGYSSFRPLFSANDIEETAPHLLVAELPPAHMDMPAPVFPTHNIEIVWNNQGKYVLVWDWPLDAQHATVMLFDENDRKQILAPTVEDYYTALGNCPQGIDITSYLAPGRVRVEIYYNRALYAKKDLVGRQTEVFYHIRPKEKGTCELAVKGAPLHVRQAVLYTVSPHGAAIIYPLYVPENASVHTFSGLSALALDSSELRAAPDMIYPSFRATRMPRLS